MKPDFGDIVTMNVDYQEELYYRNVKCNYYYVDRLCENN